LEEVGKLFVRAGGGITHPYNCIFRAELCPTRPYKYYLIFSKKTFKSIKIAKHIKKSEFRGEGWHKGERAISCRC